MQLQIFNRGKRWLVKLNNFQISQTESDKPNFWGTPYIAVASHILECGDLDTYQKEYQLAVKILKILEAQANLPFNSDIFTTAKVNNSIEKVIKDSGLYEQDKQNAEI